MIYPILDCSVNLEEGNNYILVSKFNKYIVNDIKYYNRLTSDNNIDILLLSYDIEYNYKSEYFYDLMKYIEDNTGFVYEGEDVLLVIDKSKNSKLTLKNSYNIHKVVKSGEYTSMDNVLTTLIKNMEI